MHRYYEISPRAPRRLGKTSPKMIVIDPKGIVVYKAAIDDRPTSNIDDVADARNYVAAALTEATAGKPVSIPTSRP